MSLRTALTCLTCLILPVMAQAHEYWISPHAYQVAPGEQVIADLKNGQKFKGYDMAFFESRIARSEFTLNGITTQTTGRAGDVPALKLTSTDSDTGLMQIAHQTTLQKVRYSDWEKFTGFVAHKDFTGALDRHAERGLPQTGFTEGYTRFAKSLIAIGDGTGQDHVTGLEIEIVALKNPYTDALPDGLPILLLYQGHPRSDAQIEVFERNATKEVHVFTLRTGDDGTVQVPLKPGHHYLLDSVVLREPTPALAKTESIVWESLWAALTFARP